MPIFPTFTEVRSGIKNPQKWLEHFFDGGAIDTKAGPSITEESAMAISTVYSCVTLIAETVASLPMNVYKERKGGGKDKAKYHPLFDLLHNSPNESPMTKFSWMEAQTGHLLLRGNRFDYIEQNAIGQTAALWPLDPTKIKMRRKGKRGSDYEYVRTLDDGREKTIPADKVLHVAGFSKNGLMGQSVVGFQREKLGIAAALDEFEGRFFGNGTNPGAIVSMPPEAAGRMKAEDVTAWQKMYAAQFGGLSKSHGVMFLANGEKFERASMPLDDAQFLSLVKQGATEVCGWFKVPPHMVGILDNATFSNIEHQAIQFAVNTIRPWLVRKEQAINKRLFTAAERRQGYYVENIIEGLLRGDAQARAEFYRAMSSAGALSPNDMRALENMNPVDGGDQYFVPLNWIPLDKASELADSNIEDGKAPNDGRSIRSRTTEQRSIKHRDRIVKRYAPLIERAAAVVVTRENRAIKAQLSKLRGERASADFDKWLERFYKELPEEIRDAMGPTLASFAEAIRDAAAEEIGGDPEAFGIEQFVRDYVDSYINRHISASEGQLLERNRETDLDGIEARVDEWGETRAGRIADRESVQMSNAVFQFVVFGAGLRTVWRTRGRSCPLCQQLNGKVISRGQAFLNPGDTIDPEDEETAPLTARTKVQHPSLHRGCDCYLSAI